MNIDKVIVLHGFTATPEAQWYGWLRAELAENGIDVSIPALPDTNAPEPGAWVRAANEALSSADERTLVIGHSLGNVAALRAIARQTAPKLGGYIGVAGFGEELPGFPQIDGFFSEPIDTAAVIASTPRRVVFRADDDPVVPDAIAERFAASVAAEVVMVPGGGHFLSDSGFGAFDALAGVVRAWLS